MFVNIQLEAVQSEKVEGKPGLLPIAREFQEYCREQCRIVCQKHLEKEHVKSSDGRDESASVSKCCGGGPIKRKVETGGRGTNHTTLPDRKRIRSATDPPQAGPIVKATTNKMSGRRQWTQITDVLSANMVKKGRGHRKNPSKRPIAGLSVLEEISLVQSIVDIHEKLEYLIAKCFSHHTGAIS